VRDRVSGFGFRGSGEEEVEEAVPSVSDPKPETRNPKPERKYAQIAPKKKTPASTFFRSLIHETDSVCSG